MERKNQIGFEVKVISNLIQRKIDSTASGRGLAKLTPMQGWIIDYIYNNQNENDIFQRDVEAEFTIRRSTATGILKLMEKNGLITRVPVVPASCIATATSTPRAPVADNAASRHGRGVLAGTATR